MDDKSEVKKTIVLFEGRGLYLLFEVEGYACRLLFDVSHNVMIGCAGAGMYSSICQELHEVVWINK